jgi:L-alanine-DL-glutamate epimerase-like enolase superfamily enzyme
MVSGAVVLTRIARLLTDVMQAEHAYSGCDIALWDALGKRRKTPVYKLLHSHFENARRYREMGRQFWCGCGSMAWQQATRARARARRLTVVVNAGTSHPLLGQRHRMHRYCLRTRPKRREWWRSGYVMRDTLW